MEVRDLMEAPEGTVQAGDEFHDPDEWAQCLHCRRAEVRIDMDSCPRCDGDRPSLSAFDDTYPATSVTCPDCDSPVDETDTYHVCADGARFHPRGQPGEEGRPTA